MYCLLTYFIIYWSISGHGHITYMRVRSAVHWPQPQATACACRLELAGSNTVIPFSKKLKLLIKHHFREMSLFCFVYTM